MPVRSLHHVQLAIPPAGEGSARRFYGELLGLGAIPKLPHLAARGGLWFRLGDVELHLGVEPGFRPAEKAHPAFLVDDLAALRSRLEAHGVRTWEDESLEGYRRCYAGDPFGNRLEFLESTRPPARPSPKRVP